MKLRQNVKNAISIGLLCAVSYFVVYVARNMLSAVTPQMVEAGFSESMIGTISSVFFMCYAFGQLVNGLIGDKIKVKWMFAMGLFGAGAANLLFSVFAANILLAPVLYGMTGFFLSMIYGPMTKVVAENTEPVHATRCSLGYETASYFGSPAAGLLASFLLWKSAFAVSSIGLFIMTACALIFFTLMEKKGIIKYGQYDAKQTGAKNVKILFEHQIVKFSLVSIITGVIRTSVVFWLPTYISQHLSFAPSVATRLFAAATLVISFATFIAVFIYEMLGHDMHKTLLLMFISSALFFGLTYLVKVPVLNIIFIVLAIMASNGAATMLWSRYCPSLRDTGMVSSATGFLDFLSYMAAAVANLVFANAVSAIGWGNLILVWLAIVSLGIIISLPYNKIKIKKEV